MLRELINCLPLNRVERNNELLDSLYNVYLFYDNILQELTIY